MDQAQRNSRIIYSKLAAPLTEDELRLLFTVKSDEWACVVFLSFQLSGRGTMLGVERALGVAPGAS
jgi:hypothetical protein